MVARGGGLGHLLDAVQGVAEGDGVAASRARDELGGERDVSGMFWRMRSRELTSRNMEDISGVTWES